MWLSLLASTHADPCGMVWRPPPPGPATLTEDGGEVPLRRDGAQRTWIAYEDGVETMVLRPGFTGTVQDFGMLIPFPSAPSLRKVDESLFSHIEAAVDPPPIVVDITSPPSRGVGFGGSGGIGGLIGTKGMGASGLGSRGSSGQVEQPLGYYEVAILREEAVGMYEVAVLQAGSPEALQAWMDQKGFIYPEGMEEPVWAYIESDWCFVAIKARIGGADGATPRPGMRSADTARPEGSTFDGFVQAMGFRFQTDEAVLPMRLSAHNPTEDGEEPRQVVYVLTNEAVKIRQLDEELVVRQVPGEEVLEHLSEPIPKWVRTDNELFLHPQALDQFVDQRDPERFNGLAKELIASELAAFASGDLELGFEEEQTELLNISERLGLRGAEIDARHAERVAEQKAEALDQALERLDRFTLTVLDGRFDREVLERENLAFEPYEMPEEDNLFRVEAIKPESPVVTVPWNWRPPPVQARSTSGDAQIVGAIDPASVRAVLARQRRAFQYCYQRELVKDPSLEGRVVLKFVIHPTGDVSKSTVKSSTLDNAQVENCLSQRVLRLRFPEPEGGGIAVVSFPLSFAPSER